MVFFDRQFTCVSTAIVRLLIRTQFIDFSLTGNEKRPRIILYDIKKIICVRNYFAQNNFKEQYVGNFLTFLTI